MNLQEIPVQKLIAELKRRGYEIKEPENKGLLQVGLMLEYIPPFCTYEQLGLAPLKSDP